MALLDANGDALAASRALLLETLFPLAQDEWPQVARPVRTWLARKRAATPAGQPHEQGPFCAHLPANEPTASRTCSTELTVSASMWQRGWLAMTLCRGCAWRSVCEQLGCTS